MRRAAGIVQGQIVPRCVAVKLPLMHPRKGGVTIFRATWSSKPSQHGTAAALARRLLSRIRREIVVGSKRLHFDSHFLHRGGGGGPLAPSCTLDFGSVSRKRRSPCAKTGQSPRRHVDIPSAFSAPTSSSDRKDDWLVTSFARTVARCLASSGGSSGNRYLRAWRPKHRHRSVRGRWGSKSTKERLDRKD